MSLLVVLVNSHVEVVFLVVLLVHLDAVVLLSLLLLLLSEELVVLAVGCDLSVHVELVWSGA